ncbi:MAG: hypothetical protein KAV42_00175 [Candidatus Krumholzibacteria bacterium]|nr:hypothetical protein [Candidatus Krumholzibacteria bacterium]
MTIGFYIRPEHNVAVLVHAGKVSDEEFLAFYKSFVKSDAFDSSMNLLVDLRNADSSSRSVKTLRRFAEFAEANLTDVTAHRKVAVVAPTDLSFGLARMYEAFSSSVQWDFVVFRAMDAALASVTPPKDPTNSQSGLTRPIQEEKG